MKVLLPNLAFIFPTSEITIFWVTLCLSQACINKVPSIGASQKDKSSVTANEEGTDCSADARYGLHAVLNFELGSRPEVIVVFDGPFGEEKFSSQQHAMEGWRVQEGSVPKLSYVQHLFGAMEEAGDFVVELQVNGKTLEQKAVTIKSDGCHVIKEYVSFTIPALTPEPLSPGLDYYPLDDGELLSIDPKTGLAKMTSKFEAYQAIEIVREIKVETYSNATVTFGYDRERHPEGKIVLGSFHEQGVDRGALPKVKDSSRRKIEDSGRRFIYGTP